MTTINELLSTYSDLYKEVNGFRPRGMRDWTAEQYQSEINWLMEEAKRQMEEEEIFHQHNVKLVEERIGNLIKCGAGDRETALRWMHEAEGTNGDNDFLCFELRIPYGYFS
jgi:hypothetical protein